MNDVDILKRADEVFAIEVAGLEKTRMSLDESFVRAIRLMLDCLASGGKLVVSGVGKNFHIAEKMSAIFASTGSYSIVLNPVQAMHGDLGMVMPNDILIALSFSGESDEVIRLIPAVRRHGLKVISLTGKPESTLAKMSDVHVAIPCGKEACPFGMAPTNSTTATMAMGDALAMVLIDARQFDKASYALNHPAGAIGRALVMRVTDVMRTGDKLAKISPDTSVMDALMSMTNARGGCALVVDSSDKLLGIFTDGDFRRHIASNDGILKEPVSQYMTKSPAFVKDDVFAAELLKIFEKRHINDLPVCNTEGCVVGVVGLQDLPRMKVL